jgi:hypothetical protein
MVPKYSLRRSAGRRHIAPARVTIRDAGLHHGSVATVVRVRDSALFVDHRDGQTVPINTRELPGVQHDCALTEFREEGSARYAELQHVDQRNLVVGMIANRTVARDAPVRTRAHHQETGAVGYRLAAWFLTSPRLGSSERRSAGRRSGRQR